MASDRVFQWCNNPKSVTSELSACVQLPSGAEPEASSRGEDALKVAEKLYQRRKRDRLLLLHGSVYKTQRRHSNASSAASTSQTSQATSPPPTSSSTRTSDYSHHSKQALTPPTSPQFSAAIPLGPDGRGSLKLAPPPSPRDGSPLSPVMDNQARAYVDRNGITHPALDGYSQRDPGASMSSISFTSETSSTTGVSHAVASHPHRMSRRGRRLSAASLSSAKSFKAALEQPLTPADLDRVALCGNFRERPSDLFLKVFL